MCYLKEYCCISATDITADYTHGLVLKSESNPCVSYMHVVYSWPLCETSDPHLKVYNLYRRTKED